MAHHDTYQLMISLSFDEMLTPEEQEDLNQHLRGCALCAEMWSRMNAFDRLMSVQPEIAPSASFVSSVMHRVEMYQVRRRWTPWMVVMLVVLSVMASLSLAWPSLIFSLGLDKHIASWPVTGALLAAAGEVLGRATEIATFLVDSLVGWVEFLIGTPWALGVVIAALVVSSTYIGLRESMKAGRLAEQGA